MGWTCAELWAWEVQVFEAAHLGTGNAAAYTLLSSTYSLLICTFPVSVASAGSALMGEALGKREPQRALQLLRAACKLTLVCPELCHRHLLSSTCDRRASVWRCGGGRGSIHSNNPTGAVDAH